MGKKTRSKGPSKRMNRKAAGVKHTKPSSGTSSKRFSHKVNKLAKKHKLKSVKSIKAKFDKIRDQQKIKTRRKQEELDADWTHHREILLQRQREMEEDDTPLPLDMIDPDIGLQGFLSQSSRNTQLLVGGRKKRKLMSGEELEFEGKQRTFGGVTDIEYKMEADKLKQLLPVKTGKGKVVSRFLELSRNDEGEAGGPDSEDDGEGLREDKVYGSVAEMYSERARLLADYKAKIASFSNQLMQNPEEKVHKMKEMLAMASGDGVDPLVQLTVRKLATASLLSLFLNIIPGYKLRERSQVEQEQTLSKETKKLVEFEESLLRNYRKYLQLLESIISKMKKKKGRIETGASSEWSLFRMGVSCLCKLLETHPHFNFSKNIILVLVPIGGWRKGDVNQLVCHSIQTLMRTEKSGESVLEVVKAINRFVKDHPSTVFPGLVQTYTALKIKDIDKASDTEKERDNKRKTKKREKLQRLSRKEKKYQKQLSALEKELRETEAQESRDVKRKINTKIMEQVFTTYFRILKRKKEWGSLIGPVLEGLSKFAHFINIDFFDDLVGSLLDIIADGELKTLESLYCIRTAFVILSGEGQSLNIDPYRFYRVLFKLLPRIATGHNLDEQRKEVSLCLQCLDMMIVDRRTKVGLGRVCGFTKRLSLLSLILHPDLATGCLAMLRKFFVAHPKLDVLLDEEQSVGSGKFLPHLDDPEHSNAITSHLTELKLMESASKDQRVKTLAGYISAGNKGKLNKYLSELIETKPWYFVENVNPENADATATVPVCREQISKKSLALRDGNVCMELEKIVHNMETKRCDS